MKYKTLLVVGLIGLMAGGCASAIRGKRQHLTIRTKPSQATVVVDGKEYKSPARVELTRKDVHNIVIRKEGYQPIQFDLRAQWDGATLGNVIMPGGSIGAGTDLATGADRSFSDLRTIELEPTTQPMTEPAQRYEFRGGIYTKEEFERRKSAEAENESRFFGEN